MSGGLTGREEERGRGLKWEYPAQKTTLEKTLCKHRYYEGFFLTLFFFFASVLTVLLGGTFVVFEIHIEASIFGRSP